LQVTRCRDAKLGEARVKIGAVMQNSVSLTVSARNERTVTRQSFSQNLWAPGATDRATQNGNLYGKRVHNFAAAPAGTEWRGVISKDL